MAKKILLGIWLTVLLAATPLLAQDPPAVEKFVLDNGMTFLLLPRPSPAISFEVRVKTGSVDEQPGKTGLTHLLEHMMFKGTTTIGTRDYTQEQPLLDKMDQVAGRIAAAPKDQRTALRHELEDLERQAAQYQVPGEFDGLYTLAGGIGLNASTSADLTSYHVTLPQGRLEFWAAMESARMQHPVFREFYAEREVVLKERSQRIDSNDKGTLYEQFLLHAFDNHPYRTPVIGYREDVEGLTRADLMAYYQTHYVPANTVVAIVGGFDAVRAKAVLRRYFGPIPRAVKPAVTVPVMRTASLRVTLKKPSQEEPFLIMGFRKPTVPSRDDTCFDLIEKILTGDYAARLERSLVQGGLAAEADAYNGFPGSRFYNLFLVSANPLPGHTNRELEQGLWKDLDRLKEELVTPDELARAVRLIKKSVLEGMETDAGAAGLLSLYESVYGDSRYLYRNLALLERITPEDIRTCARTYLNPDNAVIAYLEE